MQTLLASIGYHDGTGSEGNLLILLNESDFTGVVLLPYQILLLYSSCQNVSVRQELDADHLVIVVEYLFIISMINMVQQVIPCVIEIHSNH